jgi:ABC-type uncharacterized transport system fused permease/ATPase subunit
MFFISMALNVVQGNFRVWIAVAVVIAVVIVSVIYTIALARWNRQHPKHPIRYWGLIPPELKEEDEGMRMFTARATRRVYIYFGWAIPAMALVYVHVDPSPLVTLGLFAALAFGQQVIYYVAMLPVFKEKS